MSGKPTRSVIAVMRESLRDLLSLHQRRLYNVKAGICLWS